jgi:DNA polymerase-1
MRTDVLIIDGSNAAHRFKSVLPPMTGPHGERVEIMLGLLRMISSTVRNNTAQEIFVCWDGEGSRKIRTDIDPEYKANRVSKNEFELRQDSTMQQQVRSFWEMFGQYLPLTWVISEKYEADDLIAIFSHACEKRGDEALIVSNDKDMLQLVSKHVSVYSPTHEKYCRLDNFEEYTKGFPTPASHLLAKILMGDDSDNVSGIRGVGEKTALKLLKEHDWDIDRLIYRQNPSLTKGKSKVGKNLAAGADRIELNKQLMCLSLFFHYNPDMKYITIKEGKLNTEAFRQSLMKLEFLSILASFTNFMRTFEYSPKQEELFAPPEVEEETF